MCKPDGRDRDSVLVDAAVVEKIKKRRKEVVAADDSEDDEANPTDPTMFQYLSDDEDHNRHHINDDE